MAEPPGNIIFEESVIGYSHDNTNSELNPDRRVDQEPLSPLSSLPEREEYGAVTMPWVDGPRVGATEILPQEENEQVEQQKQAERPKQPREESVAATSQDSSVPLTPTRSETGSQRSVSHVTETTVPTSNQTQQRPEFSLVDLPLVGGSVLEPTVVSSDRRPSTTRPPNREQPSVPSLRDDLAAVSMQESRPQEVPLAKYRRDCETAPVTSNERDQYSVLNMPLVPGSVIDSTTILERPHFEAPHNREAVPHNHVAGADPSFDSHELLAETSIEYVDDNNSDARRREEILEQNGIPANRRSSGSEPYHPRQEYSIYDTPLVPGSVLEPTVMVNEAPVIRPVAANEPSEVNKEISVITEANSSQQQDDSPEPTLQGSLASNSAIRNESLENSLSYERTVASQDHFNKDVEHQCRLEPHLKQDGRSWAEIKDLSLVCEQKQSSQVNLPLLRASVLAKSTASKSLSNTLPVEDPTQSMTNTEREPDGIQEVRPAQPRTAVEAEYLRSGLLERGFPEGMATEMSTKLFRHRIWLIDNNENTGIEEGHSYETANGPVNCSRWTELQESMKDHVFLAGFLQIPTTFGTLHGSDAQDISIAMGSKKSEDAEIAIALQSIERTHPALGTRTPWSLLLQEVRRRAVSDHGLQQGVLVLATPERLPTEDQEFLDSVKQILDAQIALVIRHCTRDPIVVSHNTRLRKLVKGVEIVGDYESDVRKINIYNPWINYTRSLHRCREQGYKNKPLNKLVQRSLKKKEVRKLLNLLFGKASMKDAPDMESDWQRFFAYVSKVNQQHSWTMSSGHSQPCLDMRQFGRLN